MMSAQAMIAPGFSDPVFQSQAAFRACSPRSPFARCTRGPVRWHLPVEVEFACEADGSPA